MTLPHNLQYIQVIMETLIRFFGLRLGVKCGWILRQSLDYNSDYGSDVKGSKLCRFIMLAQWM